MLYDIPNSILFTINTKEKEKGTFIMRLLLYSIKRLLKKSKFKYLVRTYRDIMFQHAYSILGSELLAETAVYNAFSNALPHLDILSKRNHAKTKEFLLLVVKYTALDMQKGTGLGRENSFSKSSVFSTAFTLDSTSVYSHQIWKALSELEPIYQDFLLLLYFYGLRPEEAARLLNLSSQAVESFLPYTII